MEIMLFISGFAIGGVVAVIFVFRASKLQEKNQELLIYQGRFRQAEITISDLKLQIQTDQENSRLQNQKIIDFEKKNELLRQNQEFIEKEKREWKLDKEKILFQLSEELMKKHSEEQQKFSKNQEDKITKINEDLYKNFENVLNKVSSLNDDVTKSNGEINLTKNALLNPSGAGRTAEITLENILKSSGLKEKTSANDVGDYVLQSHFLASDNSARKPDVILFLPNNHNVIIDSKSSIFFLELQKAIEDKDPDLESAMRIKLKETMLKHLDDLKKRNYSGAKEFSEIKKNNHNQIFTTVMFLQTEKMLSIVNEIDKNFTQKALDLGIWVLTPIGLYNLLSQAKLTIGKIKQEENVEALRIEVRKLIESITTMFSKAEDIGKATSKAVKSYNEFAATFNGRFLVRVNNLNKMGIESSKKSIGQKLDKYNIVSDENIIDGEVG
ncbi:MAG: DNA recombination protein RmuC [Myxococcota bacterium]|jgi:DNA recombination protein RmuC